MQNILTNNLVLIIYLTAIIILAVLSYYKTNYSNTYKLDKFEGMAVSTSITNHAEESEEHSTKAVTSMPAQALTLTPTPLPVHATTLPTPTPFTGCVADPLNPHALSMYTCPGMFVRLSYDDQYLSAADLSECKISAEQEAILKKKHPKKKSHPENKFYDYRPPVECSSLIATANPVNDSKSLFSIQYISKDPVTKKEIYNIIYNDGTNKYILENLAQSKTLCFTNVNTIPPLSTTTNFLFENNTDGSGYAIKVLSTKTLSPNVNTTVEYYLGESDQDCPNDVTRLSLYAKKENAIYFNIEPDQSGIN
jgi:hypothetical protein